MGRLILLYYIILSFIDLSNYEYKFQRHAWYNDVITNPQEIVMNKEKFQFAIQMNLLSYDPEVLSIDLQPYFRADFGTFSWSWVTYQATQNYFDMKPCEKGDIDVTEEQFNVIGL